MLAREPTARPLVPGWSCPEVDFPCRCVFPPICAFARHEHTCHDISFDGRETDLQSILCSDSVVHLLNSLSQSLDTFFSSHVLSRASILRFLKPTFVSCACYLVALGIVVIMTGPVDRAPVVERPEGEDAHDRSSIVVPTPDLDIEDVIRIQLGGLADKHPTRGIVQCMEFASPANRRVSGSIHEFTRLVRNDRYRTLADPEAVQIGSATATEGHVQVLVTVLNSGEVSSFMWVLSRQTEPPYDGCWMTDGVFPMDNEPKPEEVIVSPPVSRIRGDFSEFLQEFSCLAITV